MKFSHRSDIQPSATVVINALALQKKHAGVRVWNLGAGEPVMNTSEVIVTAALDAMRAGKTLYPPVAGIPELRGAASEWMNRWYGSKFSAKETLVTCGGKHGLLLALEVLLNPDDEVLIIAPFWVSYPDMVKLCGGLPKIVSTRPETWKAAPEELESAIGEKTKMLILNNGSNPTGVVYTRDELEAVLSVARQHNLIVISDEVYSGLTYDGKTYVSCGSFSEYSDMVVVIQSCSKHFAMTGWRVGFVFGPTELIEVLTTLQGQSTTGTSSVSQWAALAAFEHADELIPEIRTEMQVRRDLFVSTFNTIFSASVTPPACGLYAFIPLVAFESTATDDVSWCHQVLENANVAFIPGTAFGAPGFVRASFGGTREEILSALQILEKYLSA